MSDSKQRLREYITRELKPGATFRDDESLLEAGILDSMAVTRLLEFLEDELGVQVSDDDFDPDNFETLDAIARLVSARTA